MHKLDDGDCDADDNDSTADSDDNAFVESLHPLAITIVSLRLENFTYVTFFRPFSDVKSFPH